MAKDSSFDIVSQVDMQEADNAIGQAKREVAQRYDLKDTGSSLDLDKHEGTISVKAPDEFIGRQIIDLLGTKLHHRKVDLGSIQWGAFETAGGGTVRAVAQIINGIDRDTASDINKAIRSEKLKVKVQIEGDKLRVSSSKKDVLQDAIQFVKSKDFGIPLQFSNYR